MTMELDLELEAELERELQQAPLDTTTTAVSDDDLELQDLDYKSIPTKEEQEQPAPAKTEEILLVADEGIDRFAALPRRTAIFLHGVDDLSTENITSWCNQPNLTKVEWINDSACNLVFASEEEASCALGSLLAEGQHVHQVTYTDLTPAKPFFDADNHKTHALFVRIATDEDVKVRGARNASRYYMIHGSQDGDKYLSEERQEARKAHRDRMTKSGGNGQSVFNRLGSNKRTRSMSPNRQETRSIKRERGGGEPMVVAERKKAEIPQHLKNRLGPMPNTTEQQQQE